MFDTQLLQLAHQLELKIDKQCNEYTYVDIATIGKQAMRVMPCVQ